MKFYLKKYKWIITLYSFIHLIVTFFVIGKSVSLFFFIQTLTNLPINQKEFALWLSLTFLSHIFVIILDYIVSYFIYKIELIFAKDIRLKFCNKFTEMNYKEYNNDNTGKYLSFLINDSEIIVKDVLMGVILLITYILEFIFALIIIFVFNWILGLIMLPIILLLFVIPKLFEKKLENLNNEYYDELDKFNAKAKNMIDGYPILYFANFKNKLNFVIKKYGKILVNKDNKNSIMRSLFSHTLSFSTSIFNLVIILITTLLIFQIIYVNEALFIFPPSIAIIAFNYFISENIYNSSSKILEQLVYIKASKILLKKTEIKKDEKQKSLIDFDEEFNKIELKNLQYNYGENQILKKFNCVFEKNKKYLIIGKSGSGKSTILKILLGIHHDYSGNAKINNTELKNVNPKSLYKIINYLDNNNYLFDGNIQDNVSLFDSNISTNEINKKLQILNLKEFINNKEFLSDKQRNISVGQKQRLDLARKLIMQKPILIVDEGLSNLDHENFMKIQDYLLAQKNLTFIYVTHHIKQSLNYKYDEIITL